MHSINLILIRLILYQLWKITSATDTYARKHKKKSEQVPSKLVRYRLDFLLLNLVENGCENSPSFCQLIAGTANNLMFSERWTKNTTRSFFLTTIVDTFYTQATCSHSQSQYMQLATKVTTNSLQSIHFSFYLLCLLFK